MAKRREAWFQYRVLLGLWIWPCSTKGWVLYFAAPAVALALIEGAEPLQKLLPGFPVDPISSVLLVLLALAYMAFVFTHLRPWNEPQEDEINHTAQRLFGGEPWRPRRPAPLVPERPPPGDRP